MTDDPAPTGTESETAGEENLTEEEMARMLEAALMEESTDDITAAAVTTEQETLSTSIPPLPPIQERSTFWPEVSPENLDDWLPDFECRRFGLNQSGQSTFSDYLNNMVPENNDQEETSAAVDTDPAAETHEDATSLPLHPSPQPAEEEPPSLPIEDLISFDEDPSMQNTEAEQEASYLCQGIWSDLPPSPPQNEQDILDEASQLELPPSPPREEEDEASILQEAADTELPSSPPREEDAVDEQTHLPEAAATELPSTIPPSPALDQGLTTSQQRLTGLHVSRYAPTPDDVSDNGQMQWPPSHDMYPASPDRNTLVIVSRPSTPNTEMSSTLPLFGSQDPISEVERREPVPQVDGELDDEVDWSDDWESVPEVDPRDPFPEDNEYQPCQQPDSDIEEEDHPILGVVEDHPSPDVDEDQPHPEVVEDDEFELSDSDIAQMAATVPISAHQLSPFAGCPQTLEELNALYVSPPEVPRTMREHRESSLRRDFSLLYKKESKQRLPVSQKEYTTQLDDSTHIWLVYLMANTWISLPVSPVDFDVEMTEDCPIPIPISMEIPTDGDIMADSSGIPPAPIVSDITMNEGNGLSSTVANSLDTALNSLASRASLPAQKTPQQTALGSRITLPTQKQAATADNAIAPGLYLPPLQQQVQNANMSLVMGQHIPPPQIVKKNDDIHSSYVPTSMLPSLQFVNHDQSGFANYVAVPGIAAPVDLISQHAGLAWPGHVRPIRQRSLAQRKYRPPPLFVAPHLYAQQYQQMRLGVALGRWHDAHRGGEKILADDAFTPGSLRKLFKAARSKAASIPAAIPTPEETPKKKPNPALKPLKSCLKRCIDEVENPAKKPCGPRPRIRREEPAAGTVRVRREEKPAAAIAPVRREEEPAATTAHVHRKKLAAVSPRVRREKEPAAAKPLVRREKPAAVKVRQSKPVVVEVRSHTSQLDAFIHEQQLTILVS
jgi:hypothetical protein